MARKSIQVKLSECPGIEEYREMFAIALTWTDGDERQAQALTERYFQGWLQGRALGLHNDQ